MPNLKLLINQQRLRELKRFVGKERFDLLDLGCGDGSFLRLARKHKINAVGVDKLLPKKIGIIASEIESLDLKQKFDVVIMFHVIEHLENPEIGLKKAISYLAENGILIIETPLIGNLSEKFLKNKYFAYHDPTHKHLFSWGELKQLLRSNGLEIVKTGNTFLEFPIHLLRASFQIGLSRGLIGLFLFLPLKIFSFLGLNIEIIRVYCRYKN